jgi:SecD/SecF fusion protein
MGYSLYDTVIVFDRIRENVPRMPRATFSQIANRSMSEVLTRSLATSFTVLMPVGALLLFGGETLKDFAFAMFIGTAIGVYSSVFLAAPLFAVLKGRELRFRQLEQKLSDRERVVARRSAAAVPAATPGAATGEAAAARATARTASAGTGRPGQKSKRRKPPAKRKRR